jgi:hypothetical protein
MIDIELLLSCLGRVFSFKFDIFAVLHSGRYDTQRNDIQPNDTQHVRKLQIFVIS